MIDPSKHPQKSAKLKALQKAKDKVLSQVDNLTIPQRIFISSYIDTNGNGAKSAKEVSPQIDDDYSRVKASRLIANDSVQSTLTTIYHNAGLTPPYLSRRLKRLTEATKLVPDPYNKEMVSVDDSAVQLGAIGLACKLVGMDKEDKSVTINIGGQMDEQGLARLERLAQMLKGTSEQSGEVIDAQIVSRETMDTTQTCAPS